MLGGAGAQFFGDNGRPLSGGKLYTYAAGTTTPQVVYTTESGTVAHANPIELDAAGRVPSGGEIWLEDSVSYKFVLTTRQNVTVGTWDDVTGNASGVLAAFSSSNGSSFVGFIQSGTNAVATTVQSKLRESVSVFDFMTAVQIADVRSGNASVDVTAAIQAAHSASAQVFYPRGVYRINWTESTALVTYTSIDRIRIIGDGAKLYDTRTYSADSVSAVFQLTSCTNVEISGLDYEGQPIVNKSNPTTGIGYRGATFVNLSTGCENVTVSASLKYLRYGVRAGDYTLFSTGYNRNTTCDLTTFECGYPVAFYLSTGVDLKIYAESSHRTAYLAGVHEGRIFAQFKNQYIAPSQVLITDATTNGQTYPTGTSRGCKNLDIVAQDMGSTIFTANSFCSAISMSRGDANTTFENINIDVSVVSTDTVASTLSAFAIYNSFTGVQPSYPNEWDQSFIFKNIRITGTLDRSAQTITENNGSGEIYIYAFTSGSNYGTLSGVDISGFRYYPGSGSKPRGFYYVIPGLVGTSSIENCDFGTTTPFTLITNTTSLVSFKSTRLRGSYSGTSDSPYNSTVSFIDCTIANNANQPLTNKTFFNTSVKSAKSAVVTKIIETGALSGASVTLTSAIPSGSVVVGISAIVTTDITGATGFEIGVSGDTTRYGNKFVVAQGTVVDPITGSTATTPINYPTFTNIVVTSKTSAFTGGALRIAIHYLSFTNLSL
jgi:hypothetical protein